MNSEIHGREAKHVTTNGNIGWIANYIWGIANDVLRDLYVWGKWAVFLTTGPRRTRDIKEMLKKIPESTQQLHTGRLRTFSERR